MRVITLGLLAGLFFTVACGKKKEHNPEGTPSVTAEQADQLRTLRNSTKSWTQTCAGGIMCGAEGDGDSALFAGLLCASGDSSQCSAVRLSQCSDGRPCRAPDLKGLTSNSASRDMLLGHLLQIATTKDASAANRLIDYIKSHNNKICTDADDNRCNLDPVQHTALWGTLKKVWQWVGLNPTADMNAGDTTDEGLIRLESAFAGDGYPEHLVATELYVRQKTNNWYNVLQDASNNLVSREPENPFFEYVAHGKTERAAALTLKYCSKDPNPILSQWSWQRTDAEEAWHDSMGWDCIFMANVLLQE